MSNKKKLINLKKPILYNVKYKYLIISNIKYKVSNLLWHKTIAT